ncbi:hypothetical protein MD484_g488, partial [Candolleomyces efflorescens]
MTREIHDIHDSFVSSVRTDDILIPVMGPTGVGKSTFINNVFESLGLSQPAHSSDGYESCTTVMADYRIKLTSEVASRFGLADGRHLVLVDTPGFDNISVSDTEILRRLAVWLASAYNADMKVGGVVFMYPIYPGRITRNDVSNIKVFQKICGEGGLSKVILATTRWNTCPELACGAGREKEIWENFWKGYPDRPSLESSTARLHNAPGSAWGVIETILGRMNDGVVLALQTQLVDKGKTLPQTDAAKQLRAKLLDLLHDPSNGSEARKKCLEAEVDELKIPLGKKIQGFFGIYG